MNIKLSGVYIMCTADQWVWPMGASYVCWPLDWPGSSPPIGQMSGHQWPCPDNGEGIHLTILTNSSSSFPKSETSSRNRDTLFWILLTMTIDLHNLWIKKKQTIIWPFPVFRFRLGMFLVKAGETWYRRSVSVSLPFLDLQNTLSSIDQTESRSSQVKVWTLMGELIIYQTSDKEEWAQFIRSP